MLLKKYVAPAARKLQFYCFFGLIIIVVYLEKSRFSVKKFNWPGTIFTLKCIIINLVIMYELSITKTLFKIRGWFHTIASFKCLLND